ncbi:MAG: hypothetical protein ACTHM6_13205 [Tepidisphaeraceae bacterium]
MLNDVYRLGCWAGFGASVLALGVALLVWMTELHSNRDIALPGFEVGHSHFDSWISKVDQNLAVQVSHGPHRLVPFYYYPTARPINVLGPLIRTQRFRVVDPNLAKIIALQQKIWLFDLASFVVFFFALSAGFALTPPVRRRLMAIWKQWTYKSRSLGFDVETRENFKSTRRYYD